MGGRSVRVCDECYESMFKSREILEQQDPDVRKLREKLSGMLCYACVLLSMLCFLCKTTRLSIWVCLSCTLHSAVPQPGSLLQQPYIESIGVTPRAS